MIPRTVFVGDRATLAVSLGAGDGRARPAVALPLPESSDVLVFHRLRLEDQGGERLALIEFTAYAPGFHSLPPVKIPSGFLTGLGVEISSILERDGGKVLSPPAPPLAAPGTFFLAGGAAGSLFLGLFLLFGGARLFRRHFGRFRDLWERRRLFSVWRSLLRRLKREIPGTRSDGGCEKMLDILRDRFRSFLAFYTGFDCRSMTAAELMNLPRFCTDSASPGGAYAGALVKDWDYLRYSGGAVEKERLLAMVEEAWQFTGALEQAERRARDGVNGEERK
jgi:hypothetical protein